MQTAKAEHVQETITTETPHQIASDDALLMQAIERPLAQDHADFEYALRVGAAACDARAGLAESQPQAAMKIMMGRELGIPSIVSLQSIFVIKGRTSCSGALIAALLKRAGFSWTFVEHNENGCTLAIFRNGKPMMERWLDDKGEWRERQVRISFLRADADRAGLTAKQGEKKDQPSMYDKYGPDMYFNRCITRLQKRYAPEVSHGIPLYTPDEIEEATSATYAAPSDSGLRAPQKRAQEVNN